MGSNARATYMPINLNVLIYFFQIYKLIKETYKPWQKKKTLHNSDAPTKKWYLVTWTSHLHNVVNHLKVSLELPAAAVVYL